MHPASHHIESIPTFTLSVRYPALLKHSTHLIPLHHYNMPPKHAFKPPVVNQRFVQCTTQLADDYFVFNDYQYAQFIEHHQLPSNHPRRKYGTVMSFQNTRTKDVYMLVDCAASRLGRDPSPFQRTLKLHIGEKNWYLEYNQPLINVRTNNLFQSNNKDAVWKTGGTKQLVLEEMVAEYIKDMMTSREDRLQHDDTDAFDIEKEMVELLDSDPERTDDESDVHDVVSGPHDESGDDDDMDLSRFTAQYTNDIATAADAPLRDGDDINNNTSTAEAVSTLLSIESSANPLLSHPFVAMVMSPRSIRHQ